MGRKHRLPRDPRVRETGDRRHARVPVVVQARQRADLIAPGAAIAGIDVGEDFLDAAVIAARARTVSFRRIGLAGVESVAELSSRIADAIPELVRGGVALVDSPRYPRDRDLETGSARHPCPSGRAIDGALRALVGRLSMFPTPTLDYFARCVSDPRCKPHLRALAGEMFPRVTRRSRRGQSVTGGRVFTRFMIAGFAVYRAVETLGRSAFESYPDLAYRLWMPPRGVLPPKSERVRALSARRRIVASVARRVAIEVPALRTLDEADAAILAVGAAAQARAGRGLLVLEHRAEGRFVIAGEVLGTESAVRGRSSA